MRLHKGRQPMHQVDVITSKRIADDMHFALHHTPDVADEMRHRGTRARDIGICVSPVEVWLGIQTTYRLAKGLRGNRPGFDTDAADTLLFFDHGSLFPQLRGLNRRPLSPWTTANANEIVLVASWHRSSSQWIEKVTIQRSRVETAVYGVTRSAPTDEIASKCYANVKRG